MRKILLGYFLILFALPLAQISGAESRDYLKNRIDEGNPRYRTMLNVLNLLSEGNVKTMVETGTARNGHDNFAGDGGSTIIFGEWAYSNGAKFYSVDIDPNAVSRAQNSVNYLGDNIEVICSDSIEFLRNFRGKIDFLYLDSYDFDFDDPLPSQVHHLKEIKAAYSKLHKNSIIMIDDCNLPHGGKGKLVIQYLVRRGWRIIHEEYQAILTK